MRHTVEDLKEHARQAREAMQAHTDLVDERSASLPEGMPSFGSFSEDAPAVHESLRIKRKKATA